MSLDPLFDLTGKVALVTGGSRGLGREMVMAFAARGADVIIASRKLDACEVVAGDVRALGRRALAVSVHAGRWEAIDRLIEIAYAEFGRVDILVNNAGIYEFAPLEAITVDHFDKQFRLNVLGLLLTTQEAVKQMGPEGGSIVNISSIVGPMPVAMGSVYSATKAAVDAITVSLSLELGPKKIRVNSINPGMVETEGLHAGGIAESQFRRQIEQTTPLGRIAQPADIAKAAVFMASDASGWVTGQSLVLSGGQRQ